MRLKTADLFISGAGPVGLLCAYLGHLHGLEVVIADKSSGPLQVGRADALNARTLQLLQLPKLFDELYPLGLPVNTSSVWSEGRFLSRQSAWWDSLEGCFHKHFLMLGQAHVERLLDGKLLEAQKSVIRNAEVTALELNETGTRVTLNNGDQIQAKFVIGCDGSRSFVRERFAVPFDIVRPRIVWAVIDAEIETDFPKVPEIIVFQNETSDVAWIPREGAIDRFYVRMDTKDFTLEQALDKVNRAMRPHRVSIRRLEWFSQFSVKESVASKFYVNDRVFLAGDASHIHSVNGGQGLNTGLADAFNLIWKLALVLKHGANPELLHTYESERKPVAQSVIEASGELVRSTKFSPTGTHAQDYVKIVERRAGNITGMGIRYGEDPIVGTRIFDMELTKDRSRTRLYSLLDYRKFTLLLFGEQESELMAPGFVNVIKISKEENPSDHRYNKKAVLVRPDSYIDGIADLKDASTLLRKWLL